MGKLVKRSDGRFYLEQIEDSGRDTPIEFLLKTMWNEDVSVAQRINAAVRLFLLKTMWNEDVSVAQRINAAVRLLPYMYQKQPTAIEYSGEVEYVPPFVPTRSYMRNSDDDFSDL
jgi:hypothetical protein